LFLAATSPAERAGLRRGEKFSARTGRKYRLPEIFAKKTNFYSTVVHTDIRLIIKHRLTD
jgi:hypothetical protein